RDHRAVEPGHGVLGMAEADRPGLVIEPALGGPADLHAIAVGGDVVSAGRVPRDAFGQPREREQVTDIAGKLARARLARRHEPTIRGRATCYPPGRVAVRRASSDGNTPSARGSRVPSG